MVEVRIDLDPEAVITVSKWYRPGGKMEVVIKTGSDTVVYSMTPEFITEFLLLLADADEKW